MDNLTIFSKKEDLFWILIQQIQLIDYISLKLDQYLRLLFTLVIIIFYIYQLPDNKMSFELALKKAGLPLVRSFLHAIEGVQP